MKYYIWVNGEEHGPYDFDQLYETWQDGSAPQGFLWRREDQKTFSMPDALTAEFERLNAPPVTPKSSDPNPELPRRRKLKYIEKVRRRTSYPITRMLLRFSSWITYLLIAASILIWLFGLKEGHYKTIPTEAAISSTVIFVFGILCRAVYEFGMMIADHTDVQIDIGRSLAERGSE